MASGSASVTMMWLATGTIRFDKAAEGNRAAWAFTATTTVSAAILPPATTTSKPPGCARYRARSWNHAAARQPAGKAPQGRGDNGRIELPERGTTMVP